MHPSVLQWFSTALTRADIAGRAVLEVGSYDVNGSVRPIVEAHGPTVYVGVDQSDGPGVDRVVPCADLVAVFGPGAFDVVISTEMLEHVVDWQGCVAQLCEVLIAGGLLVLTTRSPGFPYHPFPIDVWRYPLGVMARIVETAGLKVRELVPDPGRGSPGVFVIAVKPADWIAPWAASSVAEVFAGVEPEAMVAP